MGIGMGGRVAGNVMGGAVGGQPLWCTLQHQIFLGSSQESSVPMAQLNGSPLGGALVAGV